jgi:hypothetical protein
MTAFVCAVAQDCELAVDLESLTPEGVSYRDVVKCLRAMRRGR